jgi:signal transduction histidine kinase
MPQTRAGRTGGGNRPSAAEDGDRPLLARIIAAQEAERARVARDLHDQIGQALTSVLLGLRLVSDCLLRDPPDVETARTRTAEARRLVADALGEVRRVAFELRPTVLDDVGLPAALQRLAGDVSARTGVAVEVVTSGLDDTARLAPELETVVYRVVQEALTNVARHARAGRAVVSVEATARRVRARVTDDGTGFDPAAVAPASLGLAGMAERASLAGGRLAVRSAPGKGTTVTLEIPRG